jgi:hypothetical protein
LVEPKNGEASLIKLLGDNPSNEIARYHKEDIDPYESAWKIGTAQVKGEDGQDRYGTESIYVRSMFLSRYHNDLGQYLNLSLFGMVMSVHF